MQLIRVAFTDHSVTTCCMGVVGCSCKYLLKEESGCQSSELCEIFKFSDDPRSWFIGNTINTGEQH